MNFRVFPAGLCACALALPACVSYQPAPVDLAKREAAWPQRERDLPAAPGAALTAAQVEACVLRFNPSLRQARAEAGVAAAFSKESGRWDDPSLSVSVLGNLKGGADPWMVDGGLGVTIPLSGRLDVQKKLAARELSEAQARVLAAENDAVKEARLALARLAAAQAAKAALDAHLPKLDDLRTRAERLAEIGETRPVEARAVALAAADLRAQRAGLEADIQNGRLLLLELMGLRPEAPVALPAFTDGAPRAGAPVTPETLARHPRLIAEQAAHAVAEEQLHLETRRQYPDLTLGPAVNEQGGQTSVGLGLGLPLPAWNRNQQAIAKAKAQRDAAAVKLETTHQGLRHELAQALAAWRSAGEVLRVLDAEARPLLDLQDAQMRRLVQAGEVDPIRLLEVFEKRIELELRLVEAQKTLREAGIRLRALEEPVSPPSEKQP